MHRKCVGVHRKSRKKLKNHLSGLTNINLIYSAVIVYERFSHYSTNMMGQSKKLLRTSQPHYFKTYFSET